MLRRHHNPVWLFVALAFLAQSLLPAAALAEVSVRCVGAAAASPPCAHGVVPLGEKQSLASRLCVMPCCRWMVSCRSTAAACDRNAPAAPRAATVLTAPKCLITVNALGTTGAANVPSVHRWLLHSAPALAPPAPRPAAVAPGPATVSPTAPTSFSLSPRLVTASHGLRAPPSV